MSCDIHDKRTESENGENHPEQGRESHRNTRVELNCVRE